MKTISLSSRRRFCRKFHEQIQPQPRQPLTPSPQSRAAASSSPSLSCWCSSLQANCSPRRWGEEMTQLWCSSPHPRHRWEGRQLIYSGKSLTSYAYQDDNCTSTLDYKGLWPQSWSPLTPLNQGQNTARLASQRSLWSEQLEKVI